MQFGAPCATIPSSTSPCAAPRPHSTQFHLIDAMGTLTETEEQIEKELRYQSSLDLSEDAYGLICNLPLARDLQQQVRSKGRGVGAAAEGWGGGPALLRLGPPLG
jgi:hypothetical protein